MNYDAILQSVLANGTQTANRTGIDTITIPAAMFSHNMVNGFPAITRRKLFTKSVFAELIGFLNGYTSAAKFRELGTKIWDANANENAAWLSNPARLGKDDLGRVYGAQWRDWLTPGSLGSPLPKHTDQLRNVLETLTNDPTSRRMLVSAWNPGELGQMALPPCHFAWQLIATPNRVLHLNWSQRSVDVGLGLPFNIASYATLLQLLAEYFGYQPGKITGFLSDVHVYVNHVDALHEYLAAPEYPLPTLKIRHPEGVESKRPADYFLEVITKLTVDDFALVDYVCGPHIPMEMAV